MHVARAISEYLKAPLHQSMNPDYQGGDSVVWGLIRGAKQIIEATKKAGNHFYQLDNAYFGRNAYYRFTRDAFQLTELIERPANRWQHIAKQHSLELRPWKDPTADFKLRKRKIVFCLSTPKLYKFFNLDFDTYKADVMKRIQAVTDRPIFARHKETPYPIETDLQDAWCVVTHSSAAALDALMWGVPVFVTGPCAANPCALQDLKQIEHPIFPDREPLFHSLAYAQFLPEEMKLGLAWKTVAEMEPA